MLYVLAQDKQWANHYLSTQHQTASLGWVKGTDGLQSLT
jgi:hypothetical protein